MMADKLGLDYDEYVILKETGVAHGGVMSIYTDELILTNKKIICLNKGVFGGHKKTYYFPLDQIKSFNGIPQVQQGKLSNGTACLEIYMVDGEEYFNFQSKNKKTIMQWIEEIHKLFGSGVNGFYSSNEEDDSLFGAFKEVGEEFKDVGREVAEAFGFKVKKKSSTPSIIPPIICTSCGKVLAPESRFCQFCGNAVGMKPITKTVATQVTSTPQEIVCPSCGKRLNPSLKFCTECGSELSKTFDVGANIAETVPQNDDSKKKISIDQQIELLKKLKSLVDAGIISQEEFEKKKKEIL